MTKFLPLDNIQPSKRNCQQMRIGPTIVNDKKIDGKTLLDVTFNLVIES